MYIFVHLKRTFVRVRRKVLEWELKKKVMPEVFVKSVIC